VVSTGCDYEGSSFFPFLGVFYGYFATIFFLSLGVTGLGYGDTTFGRGERNLGDAEGFTLALRLLGM
jgi:hypothetical protein